VAGGAVGRDPGQDGDVTPIGDNVSAAKFFTTASVMSLISARFWSFERPSTAWT